jgi:hypothetical protein
MAIPTPEEARALKEAKEAAKKAKKAKYNNVNVPVVSVGIPYTHTHRGKVYDIDLEKPPWDSYIAALEWGSRVDQAIRADKYPHEIYMGPVKVKITRYESGGE